MFRCISIILHWQDITQKHHWNRQSMKFLSSRLIVSPPVLFSSSSGGFCGRCSFPSDSARLEKSPKKRIGRYVWKTVWVVSIFSDPWVSFLFQKTSPNCVSPTPKKSMKKIRSNRNGADRIYLYYESPLGNPSWKWMKLSFSHLWICRSLCAWQSCFGKKWDIKKRFFPPPKSHKIILLS